MQWLIDTVSLNQEGRRKRERERKDREGKEREGERERKGGIKTNDP